MANSEIVEPNNVSMATLYSRSSLVPSISPDDPSDFDIVAKPTRKPRPKTNTTSSKKKTNKKKKMELAPKPKFSFRRNIVPPFIGLAIMVGVFGLLNSEYLIAQYTMRYSKPVAISMPAAGETISMSASELLIPSINAKAPLINEPSFAEKIVQKQLQSGVVHYGNLGKFGDYGNVVIIGHSSGAAWTPGDYKYIFTFLDKLKQGDKIYVDYHGQRFIYNITSSRIVTPNNIEVLNQPTDKKLITLITCSPVGSNSKRLVVTGEQISPKLDKTATQKEQDAQTTNQVSVPSIDLPGATNRSPLEALKSIFSQ